MGTSASYRAPLRPRWQAFVAALSTGQPIERIRSELFNAGDEWQTEFSSPAIASFARTIIQLFESLPHVLETAEQPNVTLGQVIIEARDASISVGFSAALPVAERAFAKLLMQTLLRTEQPILPGGSELAQRWRAERGVDARGLIEHYVGELLAQYTRHVVEREAGRMATSKLEHLDSREVVESLAATAASIGIEAATGSDLAPDSLENEWSRIIERAFDVGKSLNPNESE